ncbi:MAG: DoxX family protein [Prevotella sp.]|nr:DoxX family protein [Prevotella sp.]
MTKKILVNIARLIVALTFILSGFAKAVDPMGTHYKIADYLAAIHVGTFIPDFVSLIASVILSAAEFWLGICLLFAIRRRVVTRIILIWLAIMTPLTLWLAIANPISDCGCFGDAVVLTNWQTFWKNIILLGCALLIARFPLEMMRFISRSNQWIVMNFTALFILIVAGRALYDLPYFDFRPYHIGTDLRKGWQQMMEGEESPYTDLFIEREDGTDITDSLLNLKGYVFLMVSPHLEKADESQFDKFNQVFEYAQEKGYPLYGLTASGSRAIERWRNGTGAEYEFCQTDDIVLKTMIRSNPGLILLHDGKIIRKWSNNNLPDESVLSDRLEKTEAGKMPEDSVPKKIMTIFLWYILPLVLLTIADRLWAWSKWIKKKEKSNKIYQF